MRHQGYRRYEVTLNLKHPFSECRTRQVALPAEIAELLAKVAGRKEPTVVARLTDRRTGAVSMIHYTQFEHTLEVEPRVHPDMEITMGLNVLPAELQQLEIAATEVLGEGYDERTWMPHTDPGTVTAAPERFWKLFRTQYKAPLEAVQSIFDRRDRAANLLAERLARQLARRLPPARGYCCPIGEDIVDEQEARLMALVHLCRTPEELADEMLRHIPEFGEDRRNEQV